MNGLEEQAQPEEFKFSITFIAQALKKFVLEGDVTPIISEESEEWYESSEQKEQYKGAIYNHSRCPNIFRVDKVVHGEKFIFQDQDGNYYTGTAKIKETGQNLSTLVTFKDYPVAPYILVVKVVKDEEGLTVDVPNILEEISTNLPNVQPIFY